MHAPGGVRASGTFIRRTLLVVGVASTLWSGHAGAFDEPAGVPEPDSYRTDAYRTPVPATLKGARVITAEEAEVLAKDKTAIFIDVYPRPPKPPNLPAGTVWRDPPHATIEGAHWLANVGYGVLAPEIEDYFKTRLESLTGSDRARPVIFFCLKDCWMSWNAARRAVEWGYAQVIWFPTGTDGWQAIGNDLVAAKPMP
ncbi:MAG: PQQ-dependent catabolism-associated CXXCW motif protein [Hyphomicrobium sp.]|nr:PQQ-dependent catabolism-associated CXXCW motif protein [Hyphomicrobium sp.]